jgi:NADH-quinone oxidoreductase subunit J
MNELDQALFFFFAACSSIFAGSMRSALAMVTRRNPVSSALWLVGTFFSLAAIYTLLGAFFIGIIQILVYAGAIMVLFLFVIMLLNLGNDFEPDIRSLVWKVTAAGTSLVMLALLARIFSGDMPWPVGERRARRAGGAGREHGVVGAIGVPMYLELRGSRSRSPGSCCWWRWWAPWSWPSGTV